MDFRPEHLALLRCPVCLGELRSESTTTICCEGCGRRYPIVDGIPVLLAARVMPPETGSGS